MPSLLISPFQPFRLLPFSGFARAIYGASGAIAALLITGLVFVSVRLINLVGRLWEQYVALEGGVGSGSSVWQTRCLEAKASPAGYRPEQGRCIRNTEEQLLRRRVPLQVLNGFLEREH